MKVLIKETFGGNRTYFNQIFLLEDISNTNPNMNHTINSNKSKMNLSREQRISESQNLMISSLSPNKAEYEIDDDQYNPTIDNKEDEDYYYKNNIPERDLERYNIQKFTEDLEDFSTRNSGREFSDINIQQEIQSESKF